MVALLEKGGPIENLALDFGLSVLRMGLPLMFVALGGLLSERAGVAQIGLEGMMLIGALLASMTALWTGSTFWGLCAGIGAAMLLALLQAVFVLFLKAEQIIVGTALNLFVFGLAPFLTKIFFDTTGSTPSLPPEQLWSYEFFILFVILVSGYLYVFHRSALGLWVRFAGENPAVLLSHGLSDVKVRLFALLGCGALAGLGGSTLTLMISSSYSPMMSAGRGFMALAAIIFGGWRPLPTLAACLLFAVIDSLQMRLQGGSQIPVQFIQILPYLVTIIALAGFYRPDDTPKGMGQHGHNKISAE